MRFASIGGSNAGNYAAAGKAVADSQARVFDVQRKTGPDYAELSKTAMKTQAAEKITAMQTAAQVTKAGINELERKTKLRHKIGEFNAEKDRFNSKRKAGVVAAIGKIGAAAVLSRDNTKGREYPKSNFDTLYENWKTKRDSLKAQHDQENSDLGDFKPEPYKPGSPLTRTDGDAGKVTTGGGNTSQGLSGTTLTGNSKVLADAIAKYESGDWGYEAFNQGGSHSGTRVLGKSGSHKEHFGTSLTDLTLSEIFKRQNTKQQGMSMDEHISSGGLHAVGRYQFIGDTLQDEVRRMGLDPNTTKFTPQVQDQIFLSHIKRVGSISPWVGPMQHYSASERARFNNMIQGL